jgi:hypothetical protein
LWLIPGDFIDDGKDLEFEETGAMGKNHFVLLVKAVNAQGDPGVFDFGPEKGGRAAS